MKKTDSNPKLVFASDKPVKNDELGTHKHLAELLVQVVRSDSDNPLVVGLFGGWGTGKSSIAEMYNHLSKEEDIENVYIDVWKYINAKERFGADFLKILATSLVKNKISRKKIVKKIDQRSEVWTTNVDLSLGTMAVVILILILVGAFSLFLLDLNGSPQENAILIFFLTTVFVNILLNWVMPKAMTTHESRVVDESYNKLIIFKRSFKKFLKKPQQKLFQLL